MPYFRSKRRYAPKQKWSVFRSSGIITYHEPSNEHQQYRTNNNNTVRVSNVDLIVNQSQQINFVPPVMKIAHLKAALSIQTSPEILSGLISMKCILMYIPEGVNFNFYVDPPILDQQNQPNYMYQVHGTYEQHPEWVLAEKIIRPTDDYISMCYLSSPIKKNLNTGDKIKLIVIASWMPMNGGNSKPIIVNWSYAARTN